MAIVIMGVSGAGKSTVGELLAKETGLSFIDADDFHPESNKEKMRNGVPLSEEDRIPWLESLRDDLKERFEKGVRVILACSALKKRYREILRSADPNYELESYESLVTFVLLESEVDVLTARLDRRAREGKHFMPSSLLGSQLESLRVDDSERIFKVDATLSPSTIVKCIQQSLIL